MREAMVRAAAKPLLRLYRDLGQTMEETWDWFVPECKAQA